MKTRAIIVGAGAAGTAAAFRLQQAGCEVRLIERDSQVGGRTQSKCQNGFIMDIAAGLLPSSYTALLKLMADVGLKDMLEPMLKPIAVFRDGQLHYIEATSVGRSLLRTKLLSPSSKLALLRAAPAAIKMWRSLDFENLGRSAPYDTENESLAGYARRVLNQEILDYLINPMQKLMYVMSAENASVVDLFWSVKNLFADEAYCVKGGMGRIVELIAQQLPVSLNTEVLAVTEAGNKVEVTMRSADGVESTDRVDLCVIATPANVVPAIDAGLSAASRDYLAKLEYSMLTDIHVQLKSRPAEPAVLIMVPDSADKDLCGILLDHNKGTDRAPPGKGSMSLYMDAGWVRQNWALPDAEIFAIAMAKLERVLPGTPELVESYHVQRWNFAATISHPGCYREMAQFVAGLDLQRRVQLAGDYFSLASVNSAVTSGELVAQRLIRNYVQ